MKSVLPLSLVAAALLVSCQTASRVPNSSLMPEPGTFQRSGQINVEVATSKTAYRPGETFHFTVHPSEDCYLSAWILGADGLTTAIYPNPHESGRVFRRGVTARLPGSSGFIFRVTPPPGREQLVVVASSTPIATAQPPAPGAWLKGMSVRPTSGGPVAERRGEARVVYEVLP